MYRLTRHVDEKELLQLAMLADWQLRELGYNPDEITIAILNREKQ
jgi:hypothetical protein